MTLRFLDNKEFIYLNEKHLEDLLKKITEIDNEENNIV